ncbi:5-dehydro-4-deoxy-D-glucuronate isomerase [Marinoscillum furvescens]|uniref:4-deoxy-L-threo-5-hexosulose-uronate ketol-isomerase n=1 Tax=Marinoscillum furvescens DSM 4134 TaxID=1122208 RepID=A0A3D9L854_MARFU|nr:5-dehydro-4-deoxy-D-glucuronate isomerase [Marinoscillum furvescens]REE02020.1 4-deoxy-L-threo-5-hexosulose-uronate ketol-isomerase [Marinoscillum furvescens DSM 4134]
MTFKVRYTHHPNDFKSYDTAQLRGEFLVTDLVESGKTHMVYSHYDRLIMGCAVPTTSPLELGVDPFMAVDYHLQKREVGIINLGGPGVVTVDNEVYILKNRDSLYVGQGAKNVSFTSEDAGQPAKFYFNSAAAHKPLPTKLIRIEDSPFIELGSVEENSKRRLYQPITYLAVETCQLMMGITEPAPGAAWNTMPPHIHELRMEVYFYFDIPEDRQVCHIMGTQSETRNLWIGNEQAVISPPWSMHCAAGTSPYAFVWGMAGDDSPIESIPIRKLK